MDQHEVFVLAHSVLSRITDDWNEKFYEKLGGELKIQWIDAPIFQAQAYSEYSPGGAPYHSVAISYNLLWQLYLDIKYYFNYLEGGMDHEAFELWWGSEKHIDALLKLANKDQAIQNIYIAAITWVYFHEVGHLSQEHGVIRNGDLPGSNIALVECDIHNSQILTGELSTLWHVTEIAADFFATSTCTVELSRHFDPRSDLLLAVNYLATGMAIVLHRFNGQNSFEEQSIPTGTHPKPFVRLEIMMPVIFELLSIPDSDERKQLVISCGRSSTTVSLYWLRAHTKFIGIPDHYFIEGMLTRPGMVDYMKHIVSKWDEIEPQVISLKRFGDEWQMLRFSESLREKIQS